MTMQEFGTACQDGANIIVLVIDNGMYGTIRMHQERRYPLRTIATELANPDYGAVARAHGAHGETVERTADFEPAFERALQSRIAAVIELRTDAEQITTRTTITDLRKTATDGR
jgi:acetolactate synthase-1/2/3 large subunit